MRMLLLVNSSHIILKIDRIISYRKFILFHRTQKSDILNNESQITLSQSSDSKRPQNESIF